MLKSIFSLVLFIGAHKLLQNGYIFVSSKFEYLANKYNLRIFLFIFIYNNNILLMIMLKYVHI